MTSQPVSKNGSCPKFVDSAQQNYFRLIKNSIYYSTHGTKVMILLCEEDKIITRFIITLKLRGRLILKTRCTIKDNKVYIPNGANFVLLVNCKKEVRMADNSE